MESLYRAAAVVANICVYADQSKTKPVAIIVPVEAALKRLAADNRIDGELEQLVHDRKLNSIVLKELIAAGRKGGLAGAELIQGVVMSDEEWTPQNVSFYLLWQEWWDDILTTPLTIQQLVTSAQKLNRRGILTKYKSDIDNAYAIGS